MNAYPRDLPAGVCVQVCVCVLRTADALSGVCCPCVRPMLRGHGQQHTCLGVGHNAHAADGPKLAKVALQLLLCHLVAEARHKQGAEGVTLWRICTNARVSHPHVWVQGLPWVNENTPHAVDTELRCMHTSMRESLWGSQAFAASCAWLAACVGQ